MPVAAVVADAAEPELLAAVAAERAVAEYGVVEWPEPDEALDCLA